MPANRRGKTHNLRHLHLSMLNQPMNHQPGAAQESAEIARHDDSLDSQFLNDPVIVGLREAEIYGNLTHEGFPSHSGFTYPTLQTIIDESLSQIGDGFNVGPELQLPQEEVIDFTDQAELQPHHFMLGLYQPYQALDAPLIPDSYYQEFQSLPQPPPQLQQMPATPPETYRPAIFVDPNVASHVNTQHVSTPHISIPPARTPHEIWASALELLRQTPLDPNKPQRFRLGLRGQKIPFNLPDFPKDPLKEAELQRKIAACAKPEALLGGQPAQSNNRNVPAVQPPLPPLFSQDMGPPLAPVGKVTPAFQQMSAFIAEQVEGGGPRVTNELGFQVSQALGDTTLQSPFGNTTIPLVNYTGPDLTTDQIRTLASEHAFNSTLWNQSMILGERLTSGSQSVGLQDLGLGFQFPLTSDQRTLTESGSHAFNISLPTPSQSGIQKTWTACPNMTEEQKRHLEEFLDNGGLSSAQAHLEQLFRDRSSLETQGCEQGDIQVSNSSIPLRQLPGGTTPRGNEMNGI